jgi:maltose/moltooligosaccharide transporter
MLPFQKKLSNSFYAVLSLPSTAMGFALAVQIAALSWLLSVRFELDIADIGLVWATGPFAGIVGQIVIGIISDNVWVWNGRRRAFILIGGVLASLGLLALPYIGVIQASLGLEGILGVAIVVSLTIDLAINVSFNPTRSIIADVTPEGRPRTKGYTWMQTVSGSFGVLAYLIGALFGNYVLIYFGAGLVLVFSVIPPFLIKEPRYLGQYGREDQDPGAKPAEGKENPASLLEIMKTILPLWGFLLYAIYGFLVRLANMPRVPNYAVEIFCMVLTLVLVVYVLQRKEKGLSREAGGLIGFQKVLAAHSFAWIGIQTMFIYMFAFVRYRVPELAELDIDPLLLEAAGETDAPSEALGLATQTIEEINETIGRIVNWSFFSLNLVAAIIPVLLLEPLAARFGRVKVHAFSVAIMSVGYFSLISMGYSPWMIYLLMAVVGIGWGATISLPFAIMSQKIPQQRMGLYMGLFNLSVVLPMFVASLGVGELVQDIEDKSIIFIIASLTTGISAIAWALNKEPLDIHTENPVVQEEDLGISSE